MTTTTTPTELPDDEATWKQRAQENAALAADNLQYATTLRSENVALSDELARMREEAQAPKPRPADAPKIGRLDVQWVVYWPTAGSTKFSIHDRAGIRQVPWMDQEPPGTVWIDDPPPKQSPLDEAIAILKSHGREDLVAVIQKGGA